ncbi:MAG: hypothetical protein ACRDSP_17120 [Pseudonocardiaceae bacterium]
MRLDDARIPTDRGERAEHRRIDRVDLDRGLRRTHQQTGGQGLRRADALGFVIEIRISAAPRRRARRLGDLGEYLP